MVQSKLSRTPKRQLGQFLTPPDLARKVIQLVPFSPTDLILEPGCGDGSFLLATIERLLALGLDLNTIMTQRVWGIELDPEMHARCLDNLKSQFGNFERHNIYCGDFLLQDFPTHFSRIVGNPPFGGTIDPDHQDRLDKLYGIRHGIKIKKETYSFFLVKCLDKHLLPGGSLNFICSDTFLTISTMKGLRYHLMLNGNIRVDWIKEFSDETNYPMVALSFTKSTPSAAILVGNKVVMRDEINKTPNLSWTPSDGDLFKEKIGDYMVCTSGMTTGKNEYFLREIQDGKIIEPYRFEFFNDPITIEKEVAKARLGKISIKRQQSLLELEKSGAVRRNIRIIPQEPVEITLPHPDYKPYNKSDNKIIYSDPSCAIFWRDNGDAVKTFKKNGNWYLHGVGGMPYFEREGLTWGLVSGRLKMRYLPVGYIMDSGAPCAFLREGVGPDEMFFILGWCLTDKANQVLKEVLNHTQNIQSKDIERMPYPWWAVENKSKCVTIVQELIQEARTKEIGFDHPLIRKLNNLYVI